MSIFSFWRRKPVTEAVTHPQPHAMPETPQTTTTSLSSVAPLNSLDIRRYFHNERGFQCYTSWFSHWGGWVSAGHCVSEAMDHTPSFVNDECISWPDGLDAAVAGCHLPLTRPAPPYIGQSVRMTGFPAGARSMETRHGAVYFERQPGQWIAHIKEPDEPVVTGMSGGPVIDAQTGEPIGIIITRNSPADLNNDRDPDESADFIALCDVWDALQNR